MTHEVAVIDTATRTILSGVPVGIYPYTTVISADGSKVYVSNWGGRVPGPTDFTDGMFPVVVDRRTGIPVTGTVSVHRHGEQRGREDDRRRTPSDRHGPEPRRRPPLRHQREQRHRVGDRHRDRRVVKTLHVGETGRDARRSLGSSPNAVDREPERTTLFVANAAQNAIAVVDVDGAGDDTCAG